MSVLGSAMEALALNPVNLVGPLLNSLWAWVAVVTAALFSFWRLRMSQYSPPTTIANMSNVKSCPSEVEPSTTTFAAETTRVAPPLPSPCLGGKEEGVLTRGASFKNRYTVTYYYQEEEKQSDENGGDYYKNDDEIIRDDDEDEDDDEVGVVNKWPKGKGLTVEIERRDWEVSLGLDWYGYQDRRVIDGSVVRLWEQTTSTSSPRSCRRRSPLGLSASPSSLVFA